jgi:hypothetical protein
MTKLSNATRSACEDKTAQYVGRSLMLLRLALVLISSLLVQTNSVSAQDDEAAVEAGRDALRDTGEYPWYDSSADDVRRIEVQKDQPASNTRTTAFSGGGSVFTMLAWIGIALLLALLVYFLVRMYLMRESGKTTVSNVDDEDVGDQIDRVENLPVKIRRHVSDLLAEARRNYEEGNYAEAIVYYYSHLLVQLDRRQLIRLTKGKTNRQYLREVTGRAGLIDLLGDTMLMFEDVFFGRHNLSRDHFDTVWRRRDEFETLVENG